MTHFEQIVGKLATSHTPTGLLSDEDPEARDFAQIGTHLVDEIVHAFGDTVLEAETESLLWGLVNAVHISRRKIDDRLDGLQVELNDLISCQDGSEVQSTELEKTTQSARELETRLLEMTHMLDGMASGYSSHMGRPWMPRSGTRPKGPMTTSAVIDAQAFMRDRKTRQANEIQDTPTLIAFTGGQHYDDTDKIFDVLDAAKERFGNIRLAHTGQNKGADHIASRWAEARRVDQIPFKPKKRNSSDRAAPFRRNEEMIKAEPRLVIVFPGTGISKNLGQKALAAKIEVMEL